MVKKIIAKPHLYFFGLVPLFILLGFLTKEVELTINFYNTYFALSSFYLCFFFSIFFVMIGVNYFSLIWAEKKPKKSLTIVHILLQTTTIFLLFTSIFQSNFNYQSSKNEVFINLDINYFLILSFLIFLLSVFIHLVNFFTSLFLKKN